MKGVLKSIVGANQTAYVEGRFIGEATRLISDILEVTKQGFPLDFTDGGDFSAIFGP